MRIKRVIKSTEWHKSPGYLERRVAFLEVENPHHPYVTCIQIKDQQEWFHGNYFNDHGKAERNYNDRARHIVPELS